MTTTPSYEELSGMTVNERLYVTDQFHHFYDVVARRDLAEVRRILESIFVDEVAIEGTLENVKTYGTAHDPTLE